MGERGKEGKGEIKIPGKEGRWEKVERLLGSYLWPGVLSSSCKSFPPVPLTLFCGPRAAGSVEAWQRMLKDSNPEPCH